MDGERILGDAESSVVVVAEAGLENDVANIWSTTIASSTVVMVVSIAIWGVFE